LTAVRTTETIPWLNCCTFCCHYACQ